MTISLLVPVVMVMGMEMNLFSTMVMFQSEDVLRTDHENPER